MPKSTTFRIVWRTVLIMVRPPGLPVTMHSLPSLVIIVGVMLESNLIAGAQKLLPGTALVYGQRITDGCIDWDTTERVLRQLADAVAEGLPARVARQVGVWVQEAAYIAEYEDELIASRSVRHVLRHRQERLVIGHGAAPRATTTPVGSIVQSQQRRR